MTKEMERGLYIHIPFCSSKCGYCDFFSFCANDIVKRNYVLSLCSQLSHISKNRDEKPKIKTVYIGGGTPSVLGLCDFEKIFEAIYDNFDTKDYVEFTVEINPESASLTFLQQIKNLGANRISMGAQSFNDDELKALARCHDKNQIYQAYENARLAGFKNISLDLMLATPLQTQKSLENSLSSIIALNPEHISTYILKIEKNSSFGKKGMQNPDDDFSSELYLFTSKVLKNAGYEHYEISNFAKSGKEAVHNSLYWAGKEYFAAGCGARGYVDKIRFFVPENIDEYILKKGLVENIVEETLDNEAIKKEKLMLSLRTNRNIPFSSLSDRQIKYMQALCKNNYCIQNENGFSMTPEGFLVSNQIITELDLRA